MYNIGQIPDWVDVYDRLTARLKPCGRETRLELAMLNHPITNTVNDWQREKEFEAHESLQESGKPDELNDLIVARVNLIVEKLAQQADVAEVSDDIATLAELVHMRKLRKELRYRRVGLRM